MVAIEGGHFDRVKLHVQTKIKIIISTVVITIIILGIIFYHDIYKRTCLEKGIA